MKLTLLGTGSPAPMVSRASPGYVVEIGDEVLVFDHGQGSHDNFLKAGFKAVDVHTAFFSHLHFDHCADYPRLVHTRWDQGAGQVPDLKVYAPEYMHRMSELLFQENGVFHPDLDGRMNSSGSRVVYRNRGGNLPRLRPSPDVTSLFDGQVIESDNWKVTVREVYHQPGYIEPYAFRIECDEGVLVYSGDTGPCKGIEEISEGADLLIHMCYFFSGTFIQDDKLLTSSGHLEAARTAAKAGVKTLVTTHFTPQMDAQGTKERCLGEMSQIFNGRIIWGEDLMAIPLEAGSIPNAG
ncbi:MAG: MBL fold metallo-hydrolase [Rhodobacteraceae bacterium]|nr:MBL fold metallo-hydrolase [Paracoccaceae bacterium]